MDWRKEVTKAEAAGVMLNTLNSPSETSKAFVMKITELMQTMPIPHEDLDLWEKLYEDVEFYADTIGHKLHQSRAVAARKLDMQFFKEMNVYTNVQRKEAQERGHKIISTRWLDVNKGDQAKPDYHSRLVGREINTHARLDLFAATPPLESLRVICSLCASNQRRRDPFVILSVDVKRAYFCAKSTRPVYTEIPIDDYEPGDEHKVGKLNLSLYGTRDAAPNWCREYYGFLEGIEFVKGKASPCNFVHAARELFLSVHGGGFTIIGPRNQVEWFKAKFQGKYEVKTTTLGMAEDLQKEARVLNRTPRFTTTAVEYEHADLIIRDFWSSRRKTSRNAKDGREKS